MAKVGMINRNEKRKKLVAKFSAKRKKLLAIARDKNASAQDRVKANMALDKLPKNSSATRIRNRCEITGRPRGFYRKFKISRIALRELANEGKLPGVRKSSW
ncbi:MAG: 30S ribosomal protein S14 [Alphaproteobacteria bacterium]|jgi:small subunit ribosomal protein S14|nr:30S ribosomal protein S14 [Alphaproteobacteria bacterium]